MAATPRTPQPPDTGQPEELNLRADAAAGPAAAQHAAAPGAAPRGSRGQGRMSGTSLAGIRWTRRSIATFALTALVIGALLALLWARLLAAGQTVATLGPAPLVGKPAPEFAITLSQSAPGLAATRFDLAQLKGHPVVLNFWGSWCTPCQDESPILEAAWRKYAAQGIIFIGVDENDTPAAAQAFLRQYGITYAIGDDPGGAIAVSYGVTGTPETVFIGRTGTIVQHEGGPVDDRTLRLGIENLLKAGS